VTLIFLLAAAISVTPLDEAGYQKLLASQKGKVVVVNFWATWCAPCRAEMPQLLAFGKRHESKGIKLLVISADEPSDTAKVSAFLDAQHAPAPHLVKKADDDEKFIDAIDPKWSGTLPATFVYDRAGRRVKSFFGELSMPDLERAVSALSP
jgi:thiol-disulfide isomerase/thioredoxin